MNADPGSIKKILILQTAFLGDAVLSTPFIRSLHMVFAGADIDVLCIPETAPVFKRNPHVHEVLIFNKRNPVAKIPSFLSLVVYIRKQRYELAISIQSSLTSSGLMVAGGVGQRLGFIRQKMLTEGVRHTKGVHKVEKILGLLKPFSDKEFDRQTELFFSDQETEKAAAVAAQAPAAAKYRVAVAPGSIWATKRWLPEYYARLVRDLVTQDIAVFLIGSQADRALCEKVRGGTGAINTAGELSVLESAALIRLMDLLVTNDSAPLHMGNAVQTDVVAIFGPTVQGLGFYPFRENDKVVEVELECRPCGTHGGRRCPRRHFRCMRNLTPDLVLHQVMETLKRQQ